MKFISFFGAVASLLSVVWSYPFPVPSNYGSGPSGNGVYVQTYTNEISSPFANVGDVVSENIDKAVKAKSIQFITPFPDSGRKQVVLESAALESIPIQADIKYAKLQQTVANLINPRPIVDTIQEHEKYGNDGSKGRALSTALIAAFEGLSNFLNAAVDTPFQVGKTVGRQLTESLNQVGGKLVGLA